MSTIGEQDIKKLKEDLIYKYNGITMPSCGNCIHGRLRYDLEDITKCGFKYFRCANYTTNQANKCREQDHINWEPEFRLHKGAGGVSSELLRTNI